MKRFGHAALTAGIASAGTTMWVRNRIGPRLDYLEEHPSDTLNLRERLYKRGPVLLAGTIITGSATLSSAELDSIERQLFGNAGHREILHSVPYLTAGRTGGQKGLNTLTKQVETACESFGIEDAEFVGRVLKETRNLVGYLVDGAFLGGLTHILGDLPTKGNAGVTALKAFTPFSGKGVNLKLLPHNNPFLNKVAIKIGLGLTLASWSVAGVYAVTPRRPSNMLRDAVSATQDLSIEELREHGFDTMFELPRRISAAARRADSSDMDTSLPSFDETSSSVVG